MLPRPRHLGRHAKGAHSDLATSIRRRHRSSPRAATCCVANFIPRRWPQAPAEPASLLPGSCLPGAALWQPVARSQVARPVYRALDNSSSSFGNCTPGETIISGRASPVGPLSGFSSFGSSSASSPPLSLSACLVQPPSPHPTRSASPTPTLPLEPNFHTLPRDSIPNASLKKILSQIASAKNLLVRASQFKRKEDYEVCSGPKGAALSGADAATAAAAARFPRPDSR